MSEWDAYAADWDDDAAARAYAEHALESLASLAAATGFGIDGVVACDFGCGTGLLTEPLAARCARVDAVDTSPAMLDVLDRKARRLHLDNVRLLEELPPAPGAYGLIVCSSVLGFVDDYPGMVTTLVDRLEPGGLFVQWDWESDPADDDPHGLTRTDVGRALGDADLVGVDVGIAFDVTVQGERMRPLKGSGRRPS